MADQLLSEADMLSRNEKATFLKMIGIDQLFSDTDIARIIQFPRSLTPYSCTAPTTLQHLLRFQSEYQHTASGFS
jgi:hypothetical protein